jgi:hypothetical protein
MRALIALIFRTSLLVIVGPFVSGVLVFIIEVCPQCAHISIVYG